MKIFGHDFSDIQRAQQGGQLSKPIDVSATSQIKLTDDDMALLRTHGSIQAVEEAGLHGTADRLRRAGVVSEQADDQTDNQAFEQWFAGSKVVSPDGKPLLVYHGTDQEFSEFSLEHLGANTAFDNTQLGFFFIAEKHLAENFVRDTSGGKRIVSAYLSIQRPLNLTTQGIFNKEDQASTLWEIFSGQKLPPAEALETIHEEIGLGEFGEITEAIVTEEARAIMQRDGFDGVISHFGAGHLEYVAFRPDQIKLVSHDVNKDAVHQHPSNNQIGSTMATNPASKNADIAQTGQFTLQIGRRHKCEVTSLAQASQVYGRLRDESGEGASTFPDGKITGAGAALRVSYNGRIWQGENPVQIAQPASQPPQEVPLQAHELTQAEFIKEASVEALHNHGRKWLVKSGNYSSFSDAPDAALAKVDAHRGAVNNALYVNDPENIDLFNACGCPSMPTDEVLQDYPRLRSMYAHVIAIAQEEEDAPAPSTNRPKPS